VLLVAVLAFSCNLPVIKQQTPQAPQPMALSGPVIDYFYATPASSTLGDKVNLTWSVTGSDNISIDQGIGKVSAADNLTISPAATTTYTLTAMSGNLATHQAATVVVTSAAAAATSAPTAVTPAAPLPIVNYFDTTPSTIDIGDIITLVWKTTGASSASIDNGIGSVNTSGRYSLIPYSTKTFTLTAANSSGKITAQVTAEVEASSEVQPVQSTTYNDVQAVIGQQFTILQEGDNSDNYRWVADYYDPASVQLISSSYTAYNPPTRGVNGQEQFVFQALQAGSTKVMVSHYNVDTPTDAQSFYYSIHILAK
jgi:predicted secreted protein